MSAGVVESPVYAILNMNRALESLDMREFGGTSAKLNILNASLPFTDATPSLKWDGEWHITIEVFRDLGAAFAVVLVLIYLLMVGWFRSFLTRRFRFRWLESCRPMECSARFSRPEMLGRLWQQAQSRTTLKFFNRLRPRRF